MKRIDINIKSLDNGGNAELAAALKEITETVASSLDLSDTQRTEILEQLNLISSQAALPAENRMTGVVKPVLSGPATGLSAIGSLAKLWSVSGDLIRAHFGVENPFKARP